MCSIAVSDGEPVNPQGLHVRRHKLRTRSILFRLCRLANRWHRGYRPLEKWQPVHGCRRSAVRQAADYDLARAVSDNQRASQSRQKTVPPY